MDDAELQDDEELQELPAKPKAKAKAKVERRWVPFAPPPLPRADAADPRQRP
jgi:hypothetical protein